MLPPGASPQAEVCEAGGGVGPQNSLSGLQPPTPLPHHCTLEPGNAPSAALWNFPELGGAEARGLCGDSVGHCRSLVSPESHREKINPFFSSNLSDPVKESVSVRCHYTLNT